jgi:phosphoribosylformylglycinamidine (FGAM) synthase-like enzyme
VDFKTKVIPVTTQAIGTISTSYRKYLSNIPGRHEIKAYKNSHISHCTHTFRKVLLQKYKTFTMRKIITCAIYCNHRAAATLGLHTQETWIVSGI